MSSEAEIEPAKYDALQQSLAGNSFQCEVVAGMIGHWAFGAGRLVPVPSLGELRAVRERGLAARCCGPATR
eukprot:7953168-Pyramimonas_sp.AAC.1